MSRRYRNTDARVDRSPIVRNGYDRRVLAVTCPLCGVTDQPCLRMRRGRPTTQAAPSAHTERYDEAERVYAGA